MFVGAKHRHMDVSYQPAKLSTDGETGYMGPTYAMSGDGEASQPGKKTGRGRAATTADDTAGLLHDAALPATLPESYRPVSNDEFQAGDDGHIDLGVPRQYSGQTPWAPDWKPREDEEDEEAGFHPGMGPPPGVEMPVGSGGSVHPAYRGQALNVSSAGQGWNHWGGVERSSEEGTGYGR